MESYARIHSVYDVEEFVGFLMAANSHALKVQGDKEGEDSDRKKQKEAKSEED